MVSPDFVLQSGGVEALRVNQFGAFTDDFFPGIGSRHCRLS